MSLMKRVKPAVAAAAMLLMLNGATAFANETAPLKVAPAVVEKENADGSISLEGVLEWNELEGGFYQVGSWGLLGDTALFAKARGKLVSITGTRFNGVSSRMVKQLVVSRFSVKGEAEVKPLPVVPVPNGLVSLEGTVEYTDLEGGFYTIEGVGLMGDEALFKTLIGKRVVVQGKEFTGMTIRQVPQVEVSSVMLPVSAHHSQPAEITVNGQKLFDGQESVVIDGVLMVPLRLVVERAGGQVEWDAREQAVAAQMSDRKAYFWIGQNEAEMNEHNVRYFTRNMIKMEKAPIIINGRTMISADALTHVLGLYEVADTDASMDLASLK